MTFFIFFSLSSFQSQRHRNTLTEEGIELVLTVMEAKELIGPSDTEQFDTFVRIYMIPEREETPAQQTKVSNIDNSFHSISFPLHFICVCREHTYKNHSHMHGTHTALIDGILGYVRNTHTYMWRQFILILTIQLLFHFHSKGEHTTYGCIVLYMKCVPCAHTEYSIMCMKYVMKWKCINNVICMRIRLCAVCHCAMCRIAYAFFYFIRINHFAFLRCFGIPSVQVTMRQFHFG